MRLPCKSTRLLRDAAILGVAMGMTLLALSPIFTVLGETLPHVIFAQ